jgi:hypothetical protein
VSADLIVVTAASSNHFGPLQYLLASLRALGARVECYDIGLTPAEVRALPQWTGFLYHKFDFAAYPPHMNVAMSAGEYAWKPAIVASVVERVRASGRGSDVVWADAGSYFHTLAGIAERIRLSRGLWIRRSSGTMRQWTHPGMFERLHADAGAYADLPNADATLIGFGIGSAATDASEALVRDVIQPWFECAMDRQCIAPDGSSRKNHRQDQAVLSYLVHRHGYAFATDTREELGVRCKCDRWFYEYIGFHVPAPIYARCCLY